MLEVKEIQVHYRNVQALYGISVSLEEGEIVIVLGANGAGKSTLLRSISGVIPLSAGSIRMREWRIDGREPADIVQAGVCHCPEGRRVFHQMTVQKNLAIGAYVRRNKREVQVDLQKTFELFPILWERRQQLAGSLSGGEQQMLAIGRSLMGRPSLLLLDEPSLGLAPLMVQTVAKYIQNINRQGVSILLVEQNAKVALSIAHRGYVMERGKIALSGKSSELLTNPQIMDAYLGG